MEGVSTSTCDRIISHDNKGDSVSQKIAILRAWQDIVTNPTWRDFITPVALSGKCVLAKTLAKEHNVVFVDKYALAMCKDINEA